MGLDFGEQFDATFENALAAAGYGKFHYILVIFGGLLYAYAAISITVLSFVLPSAQCDFGMTSSDKGWLNAAPMLGMVFGSYFWGCLADTQGRKITLIGALLVDGLCGIASSVAQYYGVFLALRFINGFFYLIWISRFFPNSYYTLMLWFPELFNRYEKFEHLHPGKVASVCDVSALQPADNSTVATCSGEVNPEVFSHTLIIGLACIPSSLAMPLLVHKMGAKWFLVAGLVLSSGVAMALYYVQTSTQNLILSCIFEALTGCCISVVYCIMVDLFPTNLRVLAAALSSTFGRFGGLTGNLMFGFLIDGHCLILICTLAAMLLIAGVFSMFLPATGKKELD
ncbi:synaptic vesicle glycoprotein 2C-like [Diaphorina citri]|uniref:Synaptic vesicle glycoprotein 2C-like n=1 Tax=Diaphorina citri TaxID=121845 RepID=A0A3Q0IVW4_DIACI|nr:synaptic vesicle glycoprotein 2C-like [Diaphorina citri]